jgi:hypothetical protein
MWDKIIMANAIKAVRSEEIRLKKTSNVFEIQRSTIKNKGNSKEKDLRKLINTRLVRKPVLLCNLEAELVSCCLMVEGEFFRITTRSIKRMAFELAIKMAVSVHC